MDWKKISVEELIPHSINMVLLDRILEVGEKHLDAELAVRADGLFDEMGRVPALVGIEYMAQGIAAYAGARALFAGQPVKIGFLLGTRRYHSNVSDFLVGTHLELHVQEILQDENGLAVFDCKLKGSGVEISARLSVFQPEDIIAYLTGHQP